MKRFRLLISGLLLGLIITAFCFAKPEKPELWEEVFQEKGNVYCIDINHIIFTAENNDYDFLMRTYDPKNGYRIYSCTWWVSYNGFFWYLRWQGSENTNKRTAIPVKPEYAYGNVNWHKNPTEVAPLTPWQEAITKRIADEAILYPEFITVCRDPDHKPLLPNYPYAKGRRR